MTRHRSRSMRAALAVLSTAALAATMGGAPAVAADEHYYTTVDQSQLEAVWADSVESVAEAASNSGPLDRVLDGKVSTFWHSQWQGGEPAPPHRIIIGVKGTPLADVGQVVLGNRAAPASGRAKDFDVYLRASGDCSANPTSEAGWDKVATRAVPTSDLGDQVVEFDKHTVKCVKVVYRDSWSGTLNQRSNSSSLAEFNLGIRHEGVRPLPDAPEGTVQPDRPLPAGVTSSAAVLNPLAADERRADNPDKTPIALNLPGGRVVGARPSTTPKVADLAATTGKNYFVDCQASATGADGTQDHPFNTLAAINTHPAFEPGDKILLKRGTVCRGLLSPQGSGQPGQPISIDAYGTATDPLPIIHGAGEHPTDMTRVPAKLKRLGQGVESAVVSFYNQQHWVVRNLELTNYSGDTNDYKHRRRGVVVALEDFGRGKDFEISDLYIHDVLGAPSKDLGGSGGIQFEAYAGASRTPTSFEGLHVHHNRIKHVSRSGINEGSDFRTRASVGGSIRDNPFEVWAPMDVHDNIVSDVAGDAIVTQFASGTKVYNNTAWDTANHHGTKAPAGNNAALWAWDADHVHYYNNHVFDTRMPRGTWDGTAFDSDYGTTGSLFEYNVTHDNEGGFMLFCGCGGLSTKTVMRYNLSINDGRGGEHHDQGPRVFFVAGQTDGEVYNNSFLVYPNAAIDKGSSASSAVFYTNNVFLAQGEVKTTWNPRLAKTSPFENNLYAGTAGTWPVPDKNMVKPDVHPLGTANLDALRAPEAEVAKLGKPIARKDMTDIVGAPVPAHQNPDLGAFQVTKVTPAETKYDSSLLKDGGFEAPASAPDKAWQLSDSGAAVTTTGPRGGKQVLQLDNPQATAKQTVQAGPNRTYRLMGAVKPGPDGTLPTVKITNPAGHTAVAAKGSDTAEEGWFPVSALMRTAFDATTLTVEVAGPGSVDDLALVPVEDYMVDGSFQSWDNTPWTGSNRSGAEAVSGGLALAVGNLPNVGDRYKQGSENPETVVPDVDAEYTLTAWVKNQEGEIRVGAKNLGPGASEDYRGVSDHNVFKQVSFDVQPKQNRFTVYCWAPDAATKGLCDDFMVTRKWDARVAKIPAVEEDAQPGEQDQPSAQIPAGKDATVNGEAVSIPAGGKFDVTVKGLQPGDTPVVLKAGDKEVSLGKLTVGEDGTGTAEFTVPADFPIGAATVSVRPAEGAALDIPVTITKPAGGEPGGSGDGNDGNGGTVTPPPGGDGNGQPVLPNPLPKPENPGNTGGNEGGTDTPDQPGETGGHNGKADQPGAGHQAGNQDPSAQGGKGGAQSSDPGQLGTAGAGKAPAAHNPTPRSSSSSLAATGSDAATGSLLLLLLVLTGTTALYLRRRTTN